MLSDALLTGDHVRRSPLASARCRAMPACRQTARSGIVSKDLLTTNPDDVAHIERIEAGAEGQGHRHRHPDRRPAVVGLCRRARRHAALGRHPRPHLLPGRRRQDGRAGHPRRPQPLDREIAEPQGRALAAQCRAAEELPVPALRLPAARAAAGDPQGLAREDSACRRRRPSRSTWRCFKAIHDGDLDGDGTPANTFGVTTADNTNELDSIFNQAFGITGTWMKDDAGEWVARAHHRRRRRTSSPGTPSSRAQGPLRQGIRHLQVRREGRQVLHRPGRRDLRLLGRSHRHLRRQDAPGASRTPNSSWRCCRSRRARAARASQAIDVSQGSARLRHRHDLRATRKRS